MEGEGENALEVSTTLSVPVQPLRRVRRSRAQYERLQRPSDVAPGQPTPSVESWCLFLTNLPEKTTAVDVQDFLAAHKTEDPDYFGPVKDVKLPLDKNCLCTGYALVELESEEGFRRALAELNGTDFLGQPLVAAPTFLGEEDEPENEDEEDEKLSGKKHER